MAAILIQHMYRARRSRNVNTFIPKQQGFASEYEVRITRIALINARSSELREIWHTLHGSERLSLRKRREAAKKAAAGTVLDIFILYNLGGEIFIYVRVNMVQAMNTNTTPAAPHSYCHLLLSTYIPT